MINAQYTKSTLVVLGLGGIGLLLVPAGLFFFGALFQPGDPDREYVRELKASAEQGGAQAQLDLGLRYAHGAGVVKDEAAADKWFRKSAAQDYAGGQLQLGYSYWEGRGVLKDQAEAVRWFRKAAVQGNAVAQRVLGGCYAQGSGVAKDERVAVHWLRKAAEQFDFEAQQLLGDCYARGTGVTPDVVEAFVWYSMGDSSLRLLHPAAMSRDEFWKRLTVEQIAAGRKRGAELKAQLNLRRIQTSTPR